jgi:predicted DNA-binding transcriptional regulator YafY
MSVVETIRACGARREMVYITYEGEQRLVEPYSFRDTRFFGWCRMRDEIRSFTISKITSARPSGQSYNPRFPVEF